MRKKAGRKSMKPNKKLFETLYYNETTTAENLAKEYGVSKHTIYHWAAEFRKEKNETTKNQSKAI